MSEETLKCPVCGNMNTSPSRECKVCFSSLVEMDEKERSILKALQHISGVGRQKAQKILDSGITSLNQLEKADLDSFLRVDGIGEATAQDILETIEGSKKEDGGLYLCGECGAFVGENSTSCPNCGIGMEEEVDEEPHIDDESQIQDNITEDTEEGDSLYLCGNCGSFISDTLLQCPFCGADLEDEKEETSETVDGSFMAQGGLEQDGEEGELYLCTNCGSFVSESSDICTSCGFSFSDEVVSTDVTPKEADDKKIDELKREQEMELKPEEPFIDIEEDISEEPEVDDSDIEELDKEIEEALEKELGMSASTIRALSLGGNIKLCSNCGRICEEGEETCPLCSFSFDEGVVEVEPTPDVGGMDLFKAKETLMKALDLEEVSEVEFTDEKTGLDICTLCGAFLKEDNERCPICGCLTSETPELDIDFDDQDIGLAYTDDTIYICDACGAFVDSFMKKCTICGSELEYARRRVDKESIDKEEDITHEAVEAFFGSTSGLELDKELKEKEVSFCHFCGAMVSQDVDRCSICLSPKKDGLDQFGLDYSKKHISVEKRSDHVRKTIQSDRDLEAIADILDSDLDLEELYEEEISDDLIDKELGLDEEEISDDLIDKELGLDEEEISDDLIDKELGLEGETTEDILVSNEIAKEDEYGIEDRELEAIVDALSTDEDIYEQGFEEQFTNESEDFDVHDVLDEISEMVKAKTITPHIITKKTYDHEDEWKRCPICDSFVDEDSEVCGVCNHCFSDRLEDDIKTISKVDHDDLEEIDTDWIDEVLEDDHRKKKPVLLKKSKPEASEGMLRNTLDRFKEYEVPLSSLSLLAFGGFSLYSYGDYGLQHITNIALLIISIFFGLGLFTLLMLKDDFLKDSFYGLIGYSVALSMAAFVPINTCFLDTPLPSIANIGLLGIAVGIFWILDFKIHHEYRYYIIWFFGILLLLIVLLSVNIASITTFSELAYPLIMTMGLGTVLVFGGTANWYRQVSGEDEVYRHMETGHRHLILGDYEDALVSFERANELTDDDSDETILEYPYYSKGVAQCSMGMYEEAIETFEELVTIAPEGVCTWNNLGIAYSRVGDQPKAIKCLKRAIDIDPSYEISWNNLGNTMYRAKRYSKALECYDKALDLNTGYRDARLNKSQVMVKLAHQNS